MNLSVDLNDIKEAQKVLKDVIRKTPLSFAQSEALRQKKIYLKQENFQLTGSFKIRGALNRLSRLSESEKRKGVVAASAGNHAQGVAYSAKKYGISSHIVMPVSAPLIKVERTKSMGAKVTLAGAYFDQAYQRATEIGKEEGRVFIHPYQDPLVIAGQGTIGLEILADLPDVQNVIVPIGGGGLIGGIASALKLSAPHIKIYGVVTEQTPGMMELKKGLELSQRILNGKLSDKIDGQGSTCVLLCGGNIDLNTVSSVIDTGLRKQGRLTRISTIVDDLPGLLAEVTSVFAKSRANILDVHHDRVSSELKVRETRIDFLLETVNSEHVKALQEELEQKGVRVLREDEK